MEQTKTKELPLPDFGRFAASVGHEVELSHAFHTERYQPALDGLFLTLTRWELTWRLSLLDALSKAQELAKLRPSFVDQLVPSAAEIGGRISKEISADPVESSLLQAARRQVRAGQYRWLDPASQDSE